MRKKNKCNVILHMNAQIIYKKQVEIKKLQLFFIISNFNADFSFDFGPLAYRPGGCC